MISDHCGAVARQGIIPARIVRESICFLEVINQQGPRLRQRHTKAVDINLLATTVSPKTAHVAFGGDDINSSYCRKKPRSAEYDSPVSLRVSIEIAKCRPSSNSQLAIVCAIRVGPQYERNISTPRTLSRS